MDEQSMFRAHWVVYHQMLKEIAESQMRLGQHLENDGEMAIHYAKSCEMLMHKLEALEKRVAELEAKQSS